MELLAEKTKDVGQEKYVPVIEKTEKGIRVKVGSIPHPMEENHFLPENTATSTVCGKEKSGVI